MRRLQGYLALRLLVVRPWAQISMDRQFTRREALPREMKQMRVRCILCATGPCTGVNETVNVALLSKC